MHAERGGIAAYSVSILNLGSERVPARSAYRKQVERIAPPELIGREAELRELAAYCTEADRDPYIWWQAPAWAGKSALMSTFVLHPPDRVRVVSFFVTARLGGQDTREAFTEVVLEQLAELLEQDLPSWPAATRDAHLLRMLEEAAETCAAQGERLILVVDGLDEDRGVTTGQDWHSIAALLPSDPPAEMRIVVAGRPHPPIPDDVPSRHRLRAPGIVRRLTSSAYAEDIKMLARQELRRFLHGTPAQQDLLGLLTAARGGLSGPDLAALTGEPLLRIEDLLYSVSGRAFTRRVSTWQPEIGPEVYLLGHEELQATAQAYFGEQRLAGYQDRLHAWAEEYRDRGWPADTPEYLLRGYFQVLAGTGDMIRLAACATDTARHERMLDITGGDAIALNELTTAFDLVAAQDNPDLTAALKLARHRDHLADRNTNVPAPLPAVWATLGQFIRAETAARSIPDPGQRVQALAAVAEELARAERHDQAIAVAAQAVSAARSITGPGQQLRALAAAAGALARTGQHEQATAAATQAETIAQSFFNTNINPHGKDEALTTAAGALARAGQHEQAIAVACSLTNSWKSRALARVAEGLAQSGHLSHAVAAAAQAAHLGAPAEAAGALVRAGQHEQAIATAAQAAARARSYSGDWKGLVLAQAAGALALTGQHEQAIATAAQAITLARSIEGNMWDSKGDLKARTMAAAASALAQIGKNEQAAAVAAQAETVTRSLFGFGRGLVPVADALAQTGQHEQAIITARSIPNQELQALALAMVAGALARAGRHEQAVAVAAEAETMARSKTHRDEEGQALAAVAEALIRAGKYEQGITAASSIPEYARGFLAQAAVELARAGRHEQATAMALSITSEYSRAEALEAIACALARAGQHEQAIAAVRSITGRSRDYQPVKALAAVTAELARAGQHEQAIAVARSINRSRQQGEALTAVAADLAQRGQFEQAIAAAHSIPGSTSCWPALRAIALVLAQTGQYEQATVVARSISPGGQPNAVVAAVALELAQRGLDEQAAVACSIPKGYFDQARAAMAAKLAMPRQATAAAARAETAARSKIDPERKPLELALAQAAGALARAGQHEQAITAAGSINNLHIDEALAEAAGALARAGQPEQAITAARSIADPDKQARALVVVAGALAANGDTTQARHVAVMACAAGQWTIALNLVVSLEPSAVTVVTGP